MRPLLIESVMLSATGGVAGLALASWARNILWSIRPPALRHAAFSLALDSRVLLYTLAVSLATGIVFGLIPGFRATRIDLVTDLKERSGQAASSGGWNPRSVLVMSQMAVSLIALIGAGLFIRSLRNANRVDPGLMPPTWRRFLSMWATKVIAKPAGANFNVWPWNGCLVCPAWIPCPSPRISRSR